MTNVEKLKIILNRKVKLNSGNRNLKDINLGEIAREIGCSSRDVLSGLKYLQISGDIKRLMPSGFSKEDYEFTVLEKSSILNN